MTEIVRILLKAHDVVHVHELKGWTGTKDIELYAKAKTEGFNVVITNDTKQLNRPLEVAAIAASGLHRTNIARTTNMVAWWVWVRRSPPCARLCPMPCPNSKRLAVSVLSL